MSHVMDMLQDKIDRNRIIGEIASVINKNNLESLADTTDYIIAELMLSAYENYCEAIKQKKLHERNL